MDVEVVIAVGGIGDDLARRDMLDSTRAGQLGQAVTYTTVPKLVFEYGVPAGEVRTLDRVGVSYDNGQFLGDRSSPVQLTAKVVGGGVVPSYPSPGVVHRTLLTREPPDTPGGPDDVRSLLGDEVYFETVRETLAAHRFGAIGTDAFIDTFATALGPEATARVRRAVDAVAMPKIDLEPSTGAAFAMTLSDPDGALVAPPRQRHVRQQRERLAAHGGNVGAFTLDSRKTQQVKPYGGHGLTV